MFLLFAVGASIALAIVFGRPLYATKNPTEKSIVSNNPTINESVGLLNTAESSGHRMNAARWLSTQFSNDPDTVINSLGNALNHDPDPVVRAQAANSLANIARQTRQKSANTTTGQRQIAELLSRQYHKEASDSVRRCIIGAAAELDDDVAFALVDEAINDNDPSVKEEALRARLERERRAQLKKLG